MRAPHLSQNSIFIHTVAFIELLEDLSTILFEGAIVTRERQGENGLVEMSQKWGNWAFEWLASRSSTYHFCAYLQPPSKVSERHLTHLPYSIVETLSILSSTQTKLKTMSEKLIEPEFASFPLKST